MEPSFPVLSLASLRLQPWRRSEGEALDEVVPEDRLRINLAKAFGNAFTRFIRVASELRSTVNPEAMRRLRLKAWVVDGALLAAGRSLNLILALRFAPRAGSQRLWMKPALAERH